MNKNNLPPMLCLKIAGWVANSVDPDETPRSAASHLGLHCLLRLVCPNTYGKYGSVAIRSNTYRRHRLFLTLNIKQLQTITAFEPGMSIISDIRELRMFRKYSSNTQTGLSMHNLFRQYLGLADYKLCTHCVSLTIWSRHVDYAYAQRWAL